ncbi:ATP-binding protein [Hellea sp.]|nr:ATP-binding protein [Hellea sp.]
MTKKDKEPVKKAAKTAAATSRLRSKSASNSVKPNAIKKSKAAKKSSAAKKITAKKTPTKKPAKSAQILVVGIGASAGGLDPFERFFDAMPVTSGIAFVVVQHLSPDFESMMDELLSRHSSMDIERVVDDMKIEPNTIYLNPPRSHMVVKNGKFKLTANLDTKKLNLPIDIFFESLADEYGQKAIGIVFSGTGSDGTRGAAAIKKVKGTVLVQAPSSAKFDGMPRSVIESDNFDAIATPTEMPDLIAKLKAGKSVDQSYSGDISDDPAKHIFMRLRDKFGTDFGYYKDATIRRRFERRAQLCDMELETYARRLEGDMDELDALYADLLIDVTSFFRDIKAFSALSKIAIENIAKKMTHDNQVRVWVAGCSSGEEPYSIAIAFAEYAREHNIPLNLKILATDVHQRSLGAAAEGIYPKASLKGLGEDQIDRYFEKNIDYYQVNQTIRRLVVFSKHNLLRDPPFTRIDMVTCRNVLIYFREEAQQKTLALFHFALRVGGYLFLGPSETLGRLDDEFEMLDRRWKIYKKLRNVRLIEATTLLPRDSSKRHSEDKPIPFLTGRTGTVNRFKKAHGDALEVMLKKFAPPGFLLNGNGEVVHVFGSAGKFVKIDVGAFSNRIIDLVDPHLRLAITAGLERVTTGEKPSFERKVILPGEGDKKSQSVIVNLNTIMGGGAGVEHFLLTLISSQSRVQPSSKNAKFLDTSESTQILQDRIRDLERDLTSTEESLQSLVEELQTSNEELQATNEELMASNEELQSTNEELHSVNEELYTVSAEHQRKIDELTVLSDDMNTLLKATNIGIIFLDERFNIRRFTPSAMETFNLLEQDVGRPFAHTTYRFEGLDVLPIVKDVGQTRNALSHEIRVAGRDYILGVLPYNTSVAQASGVVLTIVDVSLLKEAERKRISQKEIYETVFNDIGEAVMRLNLPDGTIAICNDAFAKRHGKATQDIIGEKLNTVIPKSLAQQTIKEVSGRKPGDLIKSRIEIKDEETGAVKAIMSRLIRIIGDRDGEPVAAQITGQDITDEHRYTETLEKMIAIEPVSGGDTAKALALIIKEGCEYLGLSFGILAKIQDDDIVIEGCYSQDNRAPEIGQVFQNQDTLFQYFMKDDSVFYVNEMGKSPLKDEDAYRKTGIESYIGIRVNMLGEEHGVLSFSSETPRGREFTETEKTIVKLLGRMVGWLIEREAHYQNLMQRQVELEDVNEGLNRFTYLASHDLQEPLRKIQQSGELLQMDATDLLDEEGQYFLRIMIESASRMRGLIDDLLFYSSAANQDLDKANIALPDLIKMVLKDIDVAVQDSNAKFIIGKLPVISCDAKVLKQVFVNIFGNSIKYAKQDVRPEIKVSSRRSKETTTIRVKDNGIGMHTNENVNIFEPFVRLHAKSQYRGSGIGLAVCKTICEKHGWKIDYSSVVDEGTEISIEIPNRDIS